MIASSHHERFDGNGYPQGLKGEAIPLMARILAVADVLDAITSKRHYRSAMSISNALGIMKREATGHFDPACIEALFKMSLSSFMKVHMADHLRRLEPEDLLAFDGNTLDDIMTICANAANASQEDADVLQRIYNYYQGPVPTGWEEKIKPAPRFGEDTPEVNC
jgi:hypothetical protein